MNKGMDRKLKRPIKEQKRKKGALIKTFILSLAFMVVSALFSNGVVEAVKEGISEQKSDKSDVTVKLSEAFDKETTIQVKVMFYLQKADKIIGVNRKNSYEIYDRDGQRKKQGTEEFKSGNDVNSMGCVFLIKPGDTLKIFGVENREMSDKSIPILAKAVASIDKSSQKFEYKSAQVVPLNNINEEITILPKALNSNLRTLTAEMSEIKTKDTLTSIGGEYSIKYILKNYNVFAFNDIEGTHIVGPIIAKNKAYRTGETGVEVTSSLIASDYSKGIPSYVGKFEAIKSREIATVNFNYGFDYRENPYFSVPNLYSSLFNNIVKNQNSGKYTVYAEDGKAIVGPNNTGYGPILQNDNFIDFDAAKTQLIGESKELASRPDCIVVEPEANTGYLKIDAGKSYLIKDASKLRIVDLQYPEGYDPVKNNYPYPTIINIVDENLAMSGTTFDAKNIIASDGTTFSVVKQTYPTIGGAKHQFFPVLCIGGKAFDGGQGSGSGFEYGSDNGIIWNIPNIKTQNGGYRVATQGNYDILGHIIAPNAEFWNYSDSGTADNPKWSGGNMNGCAIVDSWHAGTRESHMWPLLITNIDPSAKSLSLVGKKNFLGGNLSDYNFKFSLALFEGNTIPEGVENKNIPQTVSTKEDGSIEFLPITFNKEGNYSFRLKEVLEEPLDSDITYDKSEYKLDVTVKKNDKTKGFDINYTLSRIIDSDGKLLDKAQAINDLVFNNNKKGYILPSTGGIGTYIFVITGVVMIFISILLIWKGKFKFGH